MVWIYGTAAAVSENDLVTDLIAAWDKVLQLEDKHVVLSFSLIVVPTGWNRPTRI